jgi:hypothetical protein
VQEQLSEEIKIEVAEACISLKLKDVELVDYVLRHYRAFLSSKKPSLTLDITLTEKEYINDSSWAGLTVSGSEIQISDDYLESKIDLTQGKGSATLTSSLNGFTIGFGTLIRNIFTLILLLKDESVLLHAAAIVKDEKVYIFIGHSGSGKTTVARLSEDYTVLSDDLVIIKPANGSYGVFPAPCWLDMQTGNRENRHYQIGGIFKLVKDEKTYLKKVAPAQAMAEIFTVPHIPYKAQPIEKLLNIYSSILREFPLYELHFTKDTSFWRNIDELKT